MRGMGEGGFFLVMLVAMEFERGREERKFDQVSCTPRPHSQELVVDAFAVWARLFVVSTLLLLLAARQWWELFGLENKSQGICRRGLEDLICVYQCITGLIGTSTILVIFPPIFGLCCSIGRYIVTHEPASLPPLYLFFFTNSFLFFSSVLFALLPCLPHSASL